MIAKAPGKLVLSGAYSVLEGAPAVVAAVNRYVIADTSRPAERVTDEVRVAMEAGMMNAAPWFDASALRGTRLDGRSVKLGLGSSAAILVASLAAAWAAEDRTSDPRFLFQAALRAHREAQGGGSGIDVAASMFGGVLACRLGPSGSLSVQPHELPDSAEIHAFASPSEAKTSDMVARVKAFAKSSPREYRRLVGEAAAAAGRVLGVTNAHDLIAELAAQSHALGQLGEASGAPIFTPDVIALGKVAKEEGATFYPSGAGGGDVALFAGVSPPSERFLAEAAALGRVRLDVAIGALGVHAVSTSSPSSKR